MKGTKSGNFESLGFLRRILPLPFWAVLTMVSGCGKGNVPDPPTTFKIDWVLNEPPENWDVGSLTVDPAVGKGPVYRLKVRPTIAPAENYNVTLQCSVWLSSYRIGSNTISVPATSVTDKEISIDFGGNLSSLPQECDVRVYAILTGGYVEKTPLGNFQLTPRSISRTLNIEHDYQASWNVFSDAGSASLLASFAFGAAGKNLSFFTNQTTLLDSTLLCIGVNCTQSFSDYVETFKNQGRYMYLVSVKNVEGNPFLKKAGLSVRVGFPNSGSMIFREHLNYIAQTNGLPLTELVAWILTHELGHQNVDIVHPQDSGGAAKRYHDSPFCAMNEDWLFAGDNDSSSTNDPAGVQRHFIWNPFFCNTDVSKLITAGP